MNKQDHLRDNNSTRGCCLDMKRGEANQKPCAVVYFMFSYPWWAYEAQGTAENVANLFSAILARQYVPNHTGSRVISFLEFAREVTNTASKENRMSLEPAALPRPNPL